MKKGSEKRGTRQIKSPRKLLLESLKKEVRVRNELNPKDCLDFFRQSLMRTVEELEKIPKPYSAKTKQRRTNLVIRYQNLFISYIAIVVKSKPVKNKHPVEQFFSQIIRGDYNVYIKLAGIACALAPDDSKNMFNVLAGYNSTFINNKVHQISWQEVIQRAVRNDQLEYIETFYEALKTPLQPKSDRDYFLDFILLNYIPTIRSVYSKVAKDIAQLLFDMRITETVIPQNGLFKRLSQLGIYLDLNRMGNWRLRWEKNFTTIGSLVVDPDGIALFRKTF